MVVILLPHSLVRIAALAHLEFKISDGCEIHSLSAHFFRSCRAGACGLAAVLLGVLGFVGVKKMEGEKHAAGMPFVRWVRIFFSFHCAAGCVCVCVPSPSHPVSLPTFLCGLPMLSILTLARWSALCSLSLPSVWWRRAT